MMATTQDKGAGIWMAGAGLSCDKNQDCYAMTGNGAFDGVSQWGESFLKIRYMPATPGVAASIKVVDHWTPWTDNARAGATNAQPATKLAGMSMETEQVKPVGGGMSMPMEKRPQSQEPGPPGQSLSSSSTRNCLHRPAPIRTSARAVWPTSPI